jgi:hypothetical protein
MNNLRIALALSVSLLALSVPARADYMVNQGTQTTIKSLTFGNAILPSLTPVDVSDNPFGVSNNPFFASVNGSVSITGSLPGFATEPHFICDSGCSGGSGGGGTSSNFNSPFPAAGTAFGVSNGTNMVPITLGQALATGSLPVVLTAVQLASLTPPAAITGFALEAGNLATIVARTPALGQALAAASTPVVLTAIQQAALTPPTSVAVNNFPATQPISVASGADVSEGATSDTDCPASGTATLVGCARAVAQAAVAPLPAQSTHTVNIGAVDTISAYPAGATPITASATGTTAATTATLAATTGKTTFICGYSIRANATSATTVTNTITGVITATLSSVMWVAPAASGLGVDEQIFNPCIPASGTNQAIAIVSGAPGTGGTVSAKGWGYQQ